MKDDGENGFFFCDWKKVKELLERYGVWHVCDLIFWASLGNSGTMWNGRCQGAQHFAQKLLDHSRSGFETVPRKICFSRKCSLDLRFSTRLPPSPKTWVLCSRKRFALSKANSQRKENAWPFLGRREKNLFFFGLLFSFSSLPDKVQRKKYVFFSALYSPKATCSSRRQSENCLHI